MHSSDQNIFDSTEYLSVFCDEYSDLISIFAPQFEICEIFKMKS